MWRQCSVIFDQIEEGPMNKWIMLLILTAFETSAVSAADRTVKLAIENMDCEACPITVSKAIKGVNGVKIAKVDYNAKTATVVFDDDATTVDAIAAASTNAGYPAHLATN
jgi:periplasmic mercuric ion binding protein